MGVSGQDRKIPDLMKMRNLLNLFLCSDKEKTGKPLRWWTFGESLGASILSLCSADVASDKRLDGSVISSTVPLRLFCKSGAYSVDFEKSPGLGLFGKSGAGKTTLLPSSLPGGSQVYLVRMSFPSLSNAYNVPLESLTSFYAIKCCSSNGATRGSWQRGVSTSGTFRA